MDKGDLVYTDYKQASNMEGLPIVDPHHDEKVAKRRSKQCIDRAILPVTLQICLCFTLHFYKSLAGVAFTAYFLFIFALTAIFHAADRPGRPGTLERTLHVLTLLGGAPVSALALSSCVGHRKGDVKYRAAFIRSANYCISWLAGAVALLNVLLASDTLSATRNV